MPPTFDAQGHHAHATDADAPRPRRKRRLVLKAFAVVCLLTAGVLGYVVWQVRSIPAHYRDHIAMIERTPLPERRRLAREALSKFDAVVTLASGGRFGTALTLDENVDLGNATDTGEGSTTQARQRRGTHANSHDRGIDTDTVYTVEMSPQELNILLNEQFQNFMSRSGRKLPAGFNAPMLDHDGANRFILTFTVTAKDVSQVVSAYFQLTFAQNGEASVKVNRFDAGKMPVPAGRIGEALADRASEEQVQQVGEFLAELENYRFNPVLAASGGHKLQVLAFRIVDAGFAFDVRVLDRAEKPDLIAKAGG